jgi:hypothetical protein
VLGACHLLILLGTCWAFFAMHTLCCGGVDGFVVHGADLRERYCCEDSQWELKLVQSQKDLLVKLKYI